MQQTVLKRLTLFYNTNFSLLYVNHHLQFTISNNILFASDLAIRNFPLWPQQMTTPFCRVDNFVLSSWQLRFVKMTTQNCWYYKHLMPSLAIANTQNWQAFSTLLLGAEWRQSKSQHKYVKYIYVGLFILYSTLILFVHIIYILVYYILCLFCLFYTVLKIYVIHWAIICCLQICSMYACL